jgi:predicted N-acetyltransferase YhbS
MKIRKAKKEDIPKISVKIKKGKELTKKEKYLFAKESVKEFDNNKKPLEKELEELKDELNSIFFFVKANKELVSFGLLKPVKIKYLGKNYSILGIGNIISIKKKKGYGRILMESMLNYLKKKGKTGLGFTESKIEKFYEKIGFKTAKGLGYRFFYDYGDPNTNKKEQSEYVVYSEGKDRFITKVIKTNSKVNIPCMHW